MKKSYSFAIAAIFAALLSVPSCSYFEEPGKNENTEKETGTRTINLCFPQTKTTLDGYQPVWSTGDKIALADGTGVEYYEVKAEDAGKTQITITTELTGTITAVYPSDAAVVMEKTIQSTQVKATQNGSFAMANICLAVEDDESSNLMFKNQTAVIKVRVPAGTTKLTVTSLGKIGTDGQRGKTAADTVSINDAGSTPECNVTAVSGDNAFDGDSCFVSIKVIDGTPLYLTDLNFDVEYTVGGVKHYAQGGFSPQSIKAAGVTNPYTYEVKKNDLHTLAASSLHEYVNIEMTVNKVTKTYKWATMNIGATAETGADSYGLYFMWGDVVGQKPNGNTFSFPAAKYYPADNFNEWTPSSGFAWVNCPYTNGTYSDDENRAVFTKYVPSGEASNYGYDNYSDTKVKLDLEDDAAFANWGGAWRMPESSEFTSLINGTSTKDSDYSDYALTIKGYNLKFPAAYYGKQLELIKNIDCGYYWSSTVNDTPTMARALNFKSSTLWINFYVRSNGYPVRPVSE